MNTQQLAAKLSRELNADYRHIVEALESGASVEELREFYCDYDPANSHHNGLASV